MQKKWRSLENAHESVSKLTLFYLDLIKMAHSFSSLRKFDNYVRNRISQKAPVIRTNVNLNEFRIISNHDNINKKFSQDNKFVYLDLDTKSYMCGLSGFLCRKVS